VALSDAERASALKDIVSSDADAVVCAAKALSSDKTTTAALLALLEGEQREVCRHGILYALSWHGDRGLRDRMLAIFKDQNETPMVRGQAAECVAYMFHMLDPASDAFKEAVDTFCTALGDPSPEVRYCAVHALGAARQPALLPILERMRSDRTPVPGWLGTVGDEAERAIEHVTWK
jgi:HEAT repeat protein